MITMSDEKEEKKKKEPVPWGTSDKEMRRELCDAEVKVLESKSENKRNQD